MQREQKDVTTLSTSLHDGLVLYFMHLVRLVSPRPLPFPPFPPPDTVP